MQQSLVVMKNFYEKKKKKSEEAFFAFKAASKEYWKSYNAYSKAGYKYEEVLEAIENRPKGFKDIANSFKSFASSNTNEIDIESYTQKFFLKKIANFFGMYGPSSEHNT